MVGVTDESSSPVEPTTGEGTAEPGEGVQPPVRRRLRLLLGVAAVVLVADIVTKVLAVKLLTPGQPVSIIGDTVTWTLVRNSGAAFSMATGYTWVLTLVATGVVIGIVWMGRRLVSPWWALGLGMILGGALGNLVDRFFRSPGPLRGHVVDFLSIGWWPVFNVADPAVVGGAILLVVLSLFGFDFDTVGRRQPDDADDTVGRRQPDDADDTVGRRQPDDADDTVGRRQPDDADDTVGRRQPDDADDTVGRRQPDAESGQG
nr:MULTISPECIES: signal peptidase II [Mycolicibacterium]